MQKGVIISSVSSGNGKTLFTMALLEYFKKEAVAFKVGPDFIDTQFHKKILGSDSINLDNFMMNESQIKWIFNRYCKKENFAIIEGVMGYYDGIEKQVATYDIAKILNIPTILIISAKGTYTTTLAIIKGLIEYRKANTIKAVVLNHISSELHYKLIQSQFIKEFPDIALLGYIRKDLNMIKSRYLGLDLRELKSKDIEKISTEVLEHINMQELVEISNCEFSTQSEYPFKKIEKIGKKLVVVYDEIFSFLYRDNLEFFREIFQDVIVVSSIKEKIPQDCDAIFIAGGYIETKENYKKLNKKFLKSLKKASKKAKIYGECAGLILLGQEIKVKDKSLKMANLLPIKFELGDRRKRLGYYYAKDLKPFKGHAFHYSYIVSSSCGIFELSKTLELDGDIGAWRRENIFGTYLHTMFRSNTEALEYLA